jgi:hypothetical protein
MEAFKVLLPHNDADPDFPVGIDSSNASSNDDDDLSVSTNTSVTNNNLWGEFQTYAKKQREQPAKNKVDAIKLLSTLRCTKAPMSTYDYVMHWHLVATGAIDPRQTAHDSFEYITRQKLFEGLRKRYNYNKMCNQVTTLTLPQSKARAQIVWNDA